MLQQISLQMDAFKQENAQSIMVQAATDTGRKMHEIHSWTAADVAQWLQSSSLTGFMALFAVQGITGEDLCDLTHADLSSAGVRSLHDRKRILRSRDRLLNA